MSTSRQKRVISEEDNPQDNEGEMVPPRQKKSRGSSSGETGDGQGLSRGRKLLKREGAPASSATASAISDKNEADAKTKCKATKKVPDTLANKVTRSTAKASYSTRKNTYEQEIRNSISKKQEAKTKTVRKMKIKESATEVLTPQQRSVIEASPRLKNYTIPKKTPVPDKTLNLKHDPLLPQPVVGRDSTSYSGIPKKTTFGDQIKTVKSLLESSVNKKRNKRSVHEGTDQVTANDAHLTKVRQSKKIKHHTLESTSTEKPKINCSIPGTSCALNESIPSSAMGTKKNTPLPNDEGKQKTTSKSEINNCQDEKLLQVETTLSEEMDYDTTVPEIYQMVAEANALQPIQNDFYTFDAMEVDPAEVATTNAKDQPLLMLIADTNVWISNMSIIGQILKTLDASVNILIPWMVLQEIDYNIHSNKASNKRREFQSAAKYIHSLLCLKDPRIRGQKAAEAIIGMEFNELMADDSILSCVLQCHKQTQFITVFLTNDINLLNKALIHDINAFKVDTKIVDKLQQLASVDPSQTNSFEKDYISFQSPSQTVQTMNPNPGEVVPDYNRGGPAHIETDENVMDVDDPNGTVPSCNDAQIQNLPSTSPNNSTIIPTFDIIADNLRKSLTHIIVPNMAKEYGDGELGWRFAIKVKPPFSVESGLKCLQVHWIAVFSFLFPQRGKDVVDELLATFSKKPNPVNEEEIVSWRLNICKMALTLFSMNPDLVKSERIAETVMFLKAYIDNADNGQ